MPFAKPPRLRLFGWRRRRRRSRRPVAVAVPSTAYFNGVEGEIEQQVENVKLGAMIKSRNGIKNDTESLSSSILSSDYENHDESSDDESSTADSDELGNTRLPSNGTPTSKNTAQVASLLEQMEVVEAMCRRRDRQLQRLRIHKDGPPMPVAFWDLLQQQDDHIRRIARDQVTEKLRHVDVTSTCKKIKAQCNTKDASLPTSDFRAWLIFESATLAPATISVVLHSLAHIGIYECVTLFTTVLRDSIAAYETWFTVDVLYIVILCIGVVLMRFSGYLYWWLSSRDYGATRLAYQNRFRLQCRDARWMAWLRKHDGVRSTLFFVGYYLVYSFCTHLHNRAVLPLFNQGPRLLLDLPSSRLDVEQCLAASGSDIDQSALAPFPFVCHYLHKALLEARDELARQDDSYLWRTLATPSYDDYWYRRTMGLPVGVLLTPTMHWACYFMTIMATVGLMYKYGFVFWQKY